jgi:hypothetical protein
MKKNNPAITSIPPSVTGSAFADTINYWAIEIRGMPRFSSHNFTKYQWESDFISLYRDRELTNCLEILSEKGFEGDDVIFLLNLIGGAR